jgi:hypothetical protein
MISAQTLRVCREGKPVSTFPDHAVLADCALRPAPLHPAATFLESGKTMRAEVERLVEEIKQSVGLLRRHL